ncbi:MAG TPA: glycosyltransferase family 39 protein [Patescibacteria group bacterium]|nr:glycosyltransferase family 39 protein [Patescibacteria group bacterium]
MDKIKSWIVNNKLEFVLLLTVLLVGAFARLYKIDQYMTFLGDEGRDVIIVRRIFTQLHPPLIGPGTSIGNMYLGPAYYYMMALPLLIFNFNPVGPAIFIAILGLITILFLWKVIREWFPTKKINYGALVASFLYAISPVIIIYSRSSWNPNIMPFFALLTVYSIWKVWVTKNFKWLIITGISYACCLQSHYLGLLLAPTILVIWFLVLIKTPIKKKFLGYSFVSLFLFLLIMSPLAIFDFRHNFINSKAILAFFTDRQTTVSVLPWKAIPGMWPILANITGDLVGAKTNIVGVVVAALILIAFVFVYLIRREKYNFKKTTVTLTITMWLFFGLIGLALYKQHIYDHYYGFIFVTPFIMLGAIINNLKYKIGYLLIAILVLGIVFVDIQNSPLAAAPNMQMQRARFVATKVEEIANGERFNFALIADSNYDSAYRYFMDLDNAKVVDINPQDTKDTITDQLIVVCEREKDKCDPTHNPKAEVAGFGWTKIVAEYDNVFGVTIYKLAHTN